MADDPLYYIEQWCDEIVPCDCTLAGWAEWMAKPDDNWGRDEGVPDRTRFTASVMRFDADIVATRKGGEWSLSHEPAAIDFLAVRFGPGMGWDADSILCADDMLEGLRAYLDDEDNRLEDVEYIAVGVNEPDVTLLFLADPPRIVIEGQA